MPIMSAKAQSYIDKATRDMNASPNQLRTPNTIRDDKYQFGAEMKMEVQKRTGKSVYELNPEQAYGTLKGIFVDKAKASYVASPEDFNLSLVETELRGKYPQSFDFVQGIHNQQMEALQRMPEMQAGMIGDPNAGYQPSQGGMFPERQPAPLELDPTQTTPGDTLRGGLEMPREVYPNE